MVFILVKKKGAKVWRAAIPVKKGTTVKQIKSILSRSLRKGFVAKIVTKQQLQRLVLSLAPRRKRVRTVKRTTKRRITRSKSRMSKRRTGRR